MNTIPFDTASQFAFGILPAVTKNSRAAMSGYRRSKHTITSRHLPRYLNKHEKRMCDNKCGKRMCGNQMWKKNVRECMGMCENMCNQMWMCEICHFR